MSRVAVIVNFPSGYMVELFNAIARRGDVDLHVLYLRGLPPGRQWKVFRAIEHPHTTVKEWRVHPHFYLNSGLFRALAGLRPDVVVVTQYASIGMQLVMWAASALRVPWVYWSERPGVEWTELPIFESEALRRFFRAVALVPVRLLPRQVWGIGTRAVSRFRELTRAPCENLPYHSDLTKLLSIPRGARAQPIRFLYSGKLNERKGVDLLVAALDALADRGVEISIDFMGDGPLKPSIEALASRRPERIRHLGFKEIDDVPPVLAACDVLVCPSRYDGWGMVVTEAMAAGMPVVASRATGAALDLVVDGENGLLVDACATEPLMAAMAALHGSPDRVRAMGLAARETARAYDAPAGAARFAELVAGLGLPAERP